MNACMLLLLWFTSSGRHLVFGMQRWERAMNIPDTVHEDLQHLDSGIGPGKTNTDFPVLLPFKDTHRDKPEICASADGWSLRLPW